MGNTLTAVLLTAIAAACALFFLLFPPEIQLLPPDARGFIDWEITRTPAYPAFLRAVSLFSDELRVVTSVQLVIFYLAALSFTIVAARLLGNPALALALGLSIMANPQLVRYCFTILAEALFMAFIMAHVAAVIVLLAPIHGRAANRGRGNSPCSPAMCVVAGSTLAMVILIKPAGYSLLASLPVLLFCCRRHWRIVVAYLILPIAAILLAVCAANYVARGVFATQAFGGYSLIGHVATFIDEGTGSEYPELATAIAERLRDDRLAFRNVGSMRLYYLFSANEYNRIEWGVVIPLISDFVTRGTDPPAAESERQRQVNEISRQLAVEAIRTHPMRYSYHVAAHLYGLWFLPNLRAAESAASDDATLRATVERFPAFGSGAIAFTTLPRAIILPIKTGLVAVFALSLMWLAPLAAGRGAPPMVFPLAYGSAVVHANYLLVAAVQAGLPRYALSFWPVTMLILFGSLSAAHQLARRRLS